MTAEKWTAQLDELTALFNSEFGSLTPEQLNWKPGIDTWSMAQNLDHLIRINDSYFAVIATVRDPGYKLPWHGRMNFIVDFLGKTILKSVQPDRKKKMKTFPIWEPEASTIGGDIAARFEKHQAALKDLIGDCHALLESNAVIYSPANRNIVYKLGTAFDIIVAHEYRHFEQAKEIKKMLP